ncbi:cytochrome b/b6 domain-containing protein [Streptomyces sp. NPDC001348]
MNPRPINSSLPKPGRSAYGVATAVVLLLIPVVVLYGGQWLQDFLNFGAGVLSLVSLTSSVIWGLVTQDRIFLNTRQRIVSQAIHRVLAIASIAFLLVHVTIKLALSHTVLIAALIPFSLGVKGSAGLIGLGSLAGLLMIFVGITGALRNQFASPAPVAARWRAMHMLAYPALCAALIHGLFSGRFAKPFFMWSYELCLVAIIAALALRSAPRSFKRKVSAQLMELLGGGERQELDDLDASRARVAEATSSFGSGGASLPGYDRPGAFTDTGASPRAASAAPRYEAPEPAGSGFAAAYRAVTPPGQAQQGFAAGQTARMDLPMDMQATAAVPRVDGPSSTSGSWPVPSPPPVGEAPPSAYDPLADTGYTTPVYGNSGGVGYGGRDVYNTGETNAAFGTYSSNDTYNSGPANEPSPGASFDSPGSGEPWNTPSGGYR